MDGLDGVDQAFARQVFAGAFEAFHNSQHRYRAILFKMYDGQPYDEIVWKLVRPGPDQMRPSR